MDSMVENDEPLDITDFPPSDMVPVTTVNMATEIALDQIRDAASRGGWRFRTERQGATASIVMGRDGRQVHVDYFHGKTRYGCGMQLHGFWMDGQEQALPRFMWTWRGTNNSSTMMPHVDKRGACLAQAHADQYLASLPSTIESIVRELE